MEPWNDRVERSKYSIRRALIQKLFEDFDEKFKDDIKKVECFFNTL